MKKISKAFTLVELMVVVAIIAVLAVTIFVSYEKSKAKSRDSRRKSDLNIILTAMQLYYDENKTFNLSPCNCGFIALPYAGRGWFNLTYGGTAISIAQYLVNEKYLSGKVADPSGDVSCDSNDCVNNKKRPYMLWYSADGKKVTVYARMELSESEEDINNTCSSSPVVEPAFKGFCAGESLPADYGMNYSLTVQK